MMYFTDISLCCPWKPHLLLCFSNCRWALLVSANWILYKQPSSLTVWGLISHSLYNHCIFLHSVWVNSSFALCCPPHEWKLCTETPPDQFECEFEMASAPLCQYFSSVQGRHWRNAVGYIRVGCTNKQATLTCSTGYTWLSSSHRSTQR